MTVAVCLDKHASVGEAVSSLQSLIRQHGCAANDAESAAAQLRARKQEALEALRAAGSATALTGFMPSGPRKPGEGCEDEEQGVLSAELAPGGGARLRLTLLVAGFVVGPAGASVREITRQTGCEIRSHTESYRAPGAARERKARTFCLEGKRRAVVAALAVVIEAVERYRELCGGAYLHRAVEREQRVRGCTFYYSPPPRAAVPYAAALRTGAPAAAAPDSPPLAPLPLRRAGSLELPAAALAMGPLEQQAYVFVPVPASVAAAVQGGSTQLSTAEVASELLAALQAAVPAPGALPCAAPALSHLQRTTSLGRTNISTAAASHAQPSQLQRTTSLGSTNTRTAAAHAQPSQLLRTTSLGSCLSSGAPSLTATPLNTDQGYLAGGYSTPLVMSAGAEAVSAAAAAPPALLHRSTARRALALSLERMPAGCLDDLLAREASAAAAAAATQPPPPSFSLFNGGGGPLFAADVLSPAETRLGSPQAVLGPSAPTRFSSEDAALVACGFPSWAEFSSPCYASPALASLFPSSASSPTSPGAGTF